MLLGHYIQFSSEYLPVLGRSSYLHAIDRLEHAVIDLIVRIIIIIGIPHVDSRILMPVPILIEHKHP